MAFALDSDTKVRTLHVAYDMVEMQASLVLMLSVIHMSTRQSYWNDVPLSTQYHSRS